MDYLTTMVEIPPFEYWFTNIAAKTLGANEEVLDDVLSINTPL
jgi:hypothetical protein